MGDQLADPNEFLGREFQFHVGRIFLKFIYQLLGRRPKYIVNFGDLICFVFSWEQGEER